MLAALALLRSRFRRKLLRGVCDALRGSRTSLTVVLTLLALRSLTLISALTLRFRTSLLLITALSENSRLHLRLRRWRNVNSAHLAVGQNFGILLSKLERSFGNDSDMRFLCILFLFFDFLRSTLNFRLDFGFNFLFGLCLHLFFFDFDGRLNLNFFNLFFKLGFLFLFSFGLNFGYFSDSFLASLSTFSIVTCAVALASSLAFSACTAF